MEQQHIALAYCIDNIQLAEQIAQELSFVGYVPQHYYGSKSSPDKPLFEQLANHSGPILLLVTDNFLRSAQCMAGGREFMQDNRDAVLPVVAEGTRQDESRNTHHVPTQFERISDIIQYINYWQDQYLDLRRQRRELEDQIDEATFSDHLRAVRAISGETSEFLRLLRNTEHVTFEEVEETHYESVFRFIGDMKSWENLKKARLSRVMESVPAAAVGTSSELDREPEAPPVDIRDIPGMNLLEDQDNEIVPDDEPEEVLEEAAATPDPVAEAPEEKDEMPALDPEIILHQLHDWVSGGQTKEAILQLRDALEQYPNHLALRYQLAHLLVKYEDNFSEARQQLARLLKYDTRHTAALFLSGELSEIEEDFEEALDFYRDVSAIDPQFPDVHYRLGLILAHQFDEEEQALTEFQVAVDQDPDNADAHYQYGMLLGEYKQNFGAAAQQFEHTLLLQPKHPFAYYDLALIYHTQGKMEKAKEAYKRAVKMNPEVETPENDLAFGVIKVPEPSNGEAHKTADVQVDKTPEPEVPEAETVPEAEFEEEAETEVEIEPEAVQALAELAVEAESHISENTIEKAALDALKENILRLEEMIKAREKETEKLKQQRPGDGKTVLITGATAGIGKAAAELFARNGFRLILTGRRKDRLKTIEDQFKEDYKTDVHTLNFDVRKVKDVEKAISKLPEEWQEIDILINNAGKAKGLDPIHEGQLEHWEEMIDTNIKGLLYLTRAIAPHMVDRRHGHIINICSTAGKEVYPNGNVYCATKHAVDALTKAMRLDLHAYNIRVSQVAPAHVEETEFAEVRFDGDKERGAKVYEDFQPLRASDVAETIYFIATRPPHVNIQDVVVLGTQQASSTVIDRSGRD